MTNDYRQYHGGSRRRRKQIANNREDVAALPLVGALGSAVSSLGSAIIPSSTAGAAATGASIGAASGPIIDKIISLIPNLNNTPNQRQQLRNQLSSIDWQNQDEITLEGVLPDGSDITIQKEALAVTDGEANPPDDEKGISPMTLLAGAAILGGGAAVALGAFDDEAKTVRAYARR